MSNVLQSAPPIENIYPSLPETTNAENFRPTEISKIEKEISAEVDHHRTCATGLLQKTLRAWRNKQMA